MLFVSRSVHAPLKRATPTYHIYKKIPEPKKTKLSPQFMSTIGKRPHERGDPPAINVYSNF